MLHERDVARYLVAQVKRRLGFIRKARWEGRSGAPDYRVGLPVSQRAFWVEVKAPDADMNTPHVRAQLREHERMRECGEVVYVVSSFAEVDAALADTDDSDVAWLRRENKALRDEMADMRATASEAYR